MSKECTIKDGKSKSHRSQNNIDSSSSSSENESILRSLQLLDPILQFLTKATGHIMVPLSTLQATIPSAKVPFEHLEVLLRHGILRVAPSNNQPDFQNQWEQQAQQFKPTTFQIGFPSPDQGDTKLSGSTKTAAKRRLAALKRRLKAPDDDSSGNDPQQQQQIDQSKSEKDWTLPLDPDPNHKDEPILEMERQARTTLKKLLGLTTQNEKEDEIVPSCILPKQISYAGSHPAQEAEYADSPDWTKALHPTLLSSLFGKRRLYQHQSEAIHSAMQNKPTLVCTGTGSGKSLCFLVPVLQAAMEGHRSIILFPTKALAQDQIVKLNLWLTECNLQDEIRISTLDGDTPHSQRVGIVNEANIILTNPDTLHAAILPQWKHLYKPLFQGLKYLVIDEAHMYEGVFGAHVAMILARLYRISSLHHSTKGVVFLACSATLAHPEHHFRLLCCIPQSKSVTIVTKDGSPRSSKHFWVWNPPLLDMNGKSLKRVEIPPRKRKLIQKEQPSKAPKAKGRPGKSSCERVGEGPVDLSSLSQVESKVREETPCRRNVLRRRHSADETALLLARAVTQGVRCIAFCKTRGLVEWVYERTLSALKKSPDTAKYISKVESYRGGYTKLERRQIEEKLFHNQLLGVVGTSALELGVDIGGVDLTLHCGFPSSHASLLQQAGRAGRGTSSTRPSLAICVCFNSPVDQHLWRHPSSLLARGLTAPLSMPIYPGLVEGHLLCAGQEFPLSGSLNVSKIKSTADYGTDDADEQALLCDHDLFGSVDVYQEALESLQTQGSVTKESIAIKAEEGRVIVYNTHPSIRNPWTTVSIRSMESVNYDIVDVSHPKQGGRMDRICDEAAVMDTIPYSRIFYHAFPGAIIMHRGRRYKIVSMTRPPAFGKGFRGSMTLGAFARPSDYRYFTRPLSTLKITVVKQIERVDLNEAHQPRVKQIPPEAHTTSDVTEIYSENDSNLTGTPLSFAGCGVVTVKRNVHGYKKMSMVTREEISRSELSLPDMEYDTFAFWLDCDAEVLGPTMTGEDFGHGVHALSHAILAVAPLFVPCVMSDVQCDHSIYRPTKVCIFDARAGGSGICAQLWKSVFVEKGLVEAAIDLLESCPSCDGDSGYDGGCPACLQTGECIKFNDFLCKSSGLIIARHLFQRLKKTDEYTQNSLKLESDSEPSKLARSDNASDVASPRRKARELAMRKAKDISSASKRQMVVGRPSWPMDRSDGPAGRQVNPDV